MSWKFREFDIVNYLKTEEDIVEFLNEIAKEGDPELFQAALGDVARARGMTNMAKQTGLSRENLYRALSKDGNPRLKTLEKIFDALGIEVVFRKKTPKDKSSNPVG